MPLIDLIAGARPNFIKIAPIIHALQQQERLDFRLIHTGQHYDRNMSEIFFEQLRIPAPHVNLGAGGGSQAEQTAAIMIGYEKLLNQKASNLCLVVGDVTSTMACAITAQKAHIPVAHVEGGIRSHDWKMPEEINRLVTDAITNYFFTTSRLANQNLLQSGAEEDQIFFVGNTMIDTLVKNKANFIKPQVWGDCNLQSKNYLVLTLHRPSNVDQEQNLKLLLEEVIKHSQDLPLIFPVHPRTAQKLKSIGISHDRLHFTEPLSYLEFNYLVENSKAVITDSGGITEETTVLGVPCMTLRENTERPETITQGTNELIGTNPKSIQPAMEKLFSGLWKRGSIPELWDGKTAERIVNCLQNIL